MHFYISNTKLTDVYLIDFMRINILRVVGG